MKAIIQSDHIPVSKYRFQPVGLPPILFTMVGAFEQEMDTIDLPDRTKASGGRAKPGDTDVKVPQHHVVEVAAMDGWYEEGKDPVTLTYKKPGTMSYISLSGIVVQTYTVLGCWLNKRATPDAELENEGDLAEMTYGMCWDDVVK